MIPLGVLFALALFSITLNSYFLQDDFYFIHHLYFHSAEILGGPDLYGWFIGLWSGANPDSSGAVFFRPLVQLFFLGDFIVWGLTPFGYHLTNLALHLVTSCQVYLFAFLLTRRRMSALLAGALFLFAPGPLEAVIWISGRTDLLCALFYLSALVFFVLYRRRARVRLLVISVLAFLLALAAKEMAITLPLVLLLYDLLLGRGDWRVRWRAHLTFWLALLGYLALRFALFGAISGYRDARLQDPFALLILYARYLLLPLPIDVGDIGAAIAIVAMLALVWFGRRSRVVWFGFIWMPITLAPVFFSWPMSRYAYVPAVGICLLLGEVLGRAARTRLPAVLAVASAALILSVFVLTTMIVNQEWARSGAVSEAFPSQTRVLYPTLPVGARLLYVGVPRETGSGGSVSLFLRESLQIAYSDTTLLAQSVAKFPILQNDLARTFFLEYKRGHIITRDDVAKLETQHAIRNTTPIDLQNWDFERGAQGWEAWNDIAELRAENGLLSFRAGGDDPNLGSPQFAISALNVTSVEIRMRVQSDRPSVEGALFWITSSDGEFLPDKQVSFSVRADGKFHTYQVNPDQGGNLFVGDNIVQLRLDPTDQPAQVQMDYVHVMGSR